MPTDVSPSHDGEKQHADRHSHKEVPLSSNGNRVRDFATWPFQLHERQRKGKGLVPAEGEDLLTGRPIGEDGKRVANQLVLLDKSGLKGGWYRGEPFDFLTEQEQRDFIEAPYEFEHRTPEQNDAVYLYNRASKYIRTKDWSYQQINTKIQGKREKLEKRAQISHEEEQMHPFDFLTSKERSDYNDAPNASANRTAEQNDAVYLYNRASKYINKGGDWDYSKIDAKIQEKREKRAMQDLYELDLEREMSPFHFMTEQEQRDYNDAPYRARDRTDEQERIVRLYNRIQSDINAGYQKEYIEEQAEAHRRDIYGEAGPSSPMQDLYELDLEREMSPFHFMTEQEQRDYHDAPYRARDRTDEQERIVRLYNRIQSDINAGYQKEYIEEQAEAHRRDIYGEAGPSSPIEVSSSSGPSHPESRENQIKALVDKVVERHGQHDLWDRDNEDIRNFIWNNRMSRDEHLIAKAYFDDKYGNLNTQIRRSIKASLRRTYSL